MKRTRIRAVVATVALAAAGTVALGASPASAAPSTVELLAKSIGSSYAGPYATVTTGVGAGATATMSLQIVNHTGQIGQYSLTQYGYVGDRYVVKAGTTDISSLVYDSPHGYVTNALAPGKSQIITVSLKAPATIQKWYRWATQFVLNDLDGYEIDQALLILNAKTATTVGSSSQDMYVSTASGVVVGTEPWQDTTFYSGVAAKLGGSVSYTVRLQNNTTSPTQIHVTASPTSQVVGSCGGPFGETPWAATAKIGTVDVTSAVFGVNGYTTPVLTKGKFTNLVITVKVPPALYDGCAESWYLVTTDEEAFNLVTNSIAT